MLRRDFYGGIFVKRNDGLYKALAKGACADQLTYFAVLNCARYNLGCGGRAAIDQDYHRIRAGAKPPSVLARLHIH